MRQKKKNILIFHRSPFGASTDWYYLSVFGLKYFKINMLCMSNGNACIDHAGVNVEYISNRGGRLIRAIRLFSALRRKAILHDYDVIIIPFFYGCWLIPLLLYGKRNRILLDIRTGDVNPNRFKRSLNNLFLRMTTRFYQHISIISLNLASYLNLNPEKLYYLPLGGIVMDCGKKYFNEIALFYVGTFYNRDLDKVIRAIAAFQKLYSDSINIRLLMVGDGPGNIRAELISLAQELGVADICEMPGFVQRCDLLPYIQRCNVGLSFIPMSPAYEYQPPTKTFEYVLAGMPVIATKTFANKQVVSAENGILCEDSVHSLVNALREFSDRRENYDSNVIRNSLMDYDWKNIVDNHFAPIINHIASGRCRIKNPKKLGSDMVRAD